MAVCPLAGRRGSPAFRGHDRERSDRRWEGGIESTLRTLGLDWDEGPCRQRERSDRYRSAADQLLSSGRAYRCWCTDADLQAMRDASVAEDRPPHWEHDRHRRFQSPRAGPAAVRFAAPLDGTTSFVDAVRGEVSVDNATIGDRVLVRADETPVHQLAVVVDDFDMGITHIIRGVDVLPSTPLQINMALALGQNDLPVFAHVPSSWALTAPSCRLDTVPSRSRTTWRSEWYPRL